HLHRLSFENKMHSSLLQFDQYLHIQRTYHFLRPSLLKGLAGLPITVVPAGTLFVTTAPIPITAPAPNTIGFPGRPCCIIAPVPTYTLHPIRTLRIQFTS